MNKLERDLEHNSPVYASVGTPIEFQDGGKHRQAQAGFWKLLLIAFPRMAVTMAWAAQWAAIGPYLSTMLSRSAVQAIQFIGPVCGILVAPTIGALSDTCSNKFGRRRPFIFCAAIGSIICYILMGYTREMGNALGDYGNGAEGEPTSRTYTALLTALFYLWMDITVNFVQTPIFLLISDFAGDRQTLGSALGQGWAMFGSILVSVYIELWGAAYLTLHYFLGMLAVSMAICAFAVCFVADEIPLEKNLKNTGGTCKAIGNAFEQIYYGVRSLPYTLGIYALILVCITFGYTAYNGNKGQFFGLEIYGGDANGADACGVTCSKAQTDYNKDLLQGSDGLQQGRATRWRPGRSHRQYRGLHFLLGRARSGETVRGPVGRDHLAHPADPACGFGLHHVQQPGRLLRGHRIIHASHHHVHGRADHLPRYGRRRGHRCASRCHQLG